MRTEALRRVRQLLGAAKRLADPTDVLGREARARLPVSTGLSPEGIEMALRRSLEVDPSEDELRALLSGEPDVGVVNILLSPAVFTGAHRAIALGLAASRRVKVRASRREPVFPELLLRGAEGLFELVPELSPAPGDHLVLYGRAESIAAVRGKVRPGVSLSAHGPGFGVVVVGPGSWSAEGTDRAAAAIALDIAVFDQRGCLSPRAVVLQGDRRLAERLARALARALADLEHRVPLGRLSPDERAELARFRDTAAATGRIFSSGSGFVGLTEAEHLLVAPVGRNLWVVAVPNAVAVLADYAESITTYAATGDREFLAELQSVLPEARPATLGRMQSPPFDGPVDLRQSR